MADIPINAIDRRIQFTGNTGLGPFAFTFNILADSDIVVYKNDTLLTLTTDYTILTSADGTGSVTLTGSGNGTALVSSDFLTIVGGRQLARTTDFVTAGDLLASSLNEQLDSNVIMVQQLDEKIERTLRIDQSDVTADMVLPKKDDRANKTLGFDANGLPAVGEEIGDYKGNWAASTTYAIRDLVKDTSTNNIFRANTAHTSSGAQPLTTNVDSAKWDLIVDAAAATTSATAAASSATAAATSATASATSATASATSASASSTSATNAATSETNAATSETNAANSATASAASAAAADATFDLFDDAYLGAKASNPTLDNDGNALQDGALYFDTTNNVMKVYDLGSTTWLQLTPTVSNQTNINTVAGISSDVTAVAGNSTNINAVAADATDIGTVATNIANVNSVGGSIANVNTVANNLTDINSFANTYFISATAPSSPTEGDLWFDTTNDIMKVYDGSGFVNAGSSVNGTANRVVYTATAGQTTFSATYDAGYVDVYLNGVKLIAGTDFTATSGSSVVLATGAALNDTVDIVGYGTFNLLSTAINDLSDVNTSGITNGQVLAYNSTSTNFEPTTITSDLVDDTTPQLGGNLDLNGNNITGTGNIPAANLTGTLPAIDGSALTGISAGATGGGSDEIFYENGQTITTNYTITNGKNAMSAGPITINTGVTVTVGTGENWTVV